MPILNWDRIESDRDYNYYNFGYDSLAEMNDSKMTSWVKLETALVTYSFPTEYREVGSYVYDYLSKAKPDMIKEYRLTPFLMRVQSLNRTFIDKIYALCDYYMEGKSKRYSRHLYDLYKLYPYMTIDDSFIQLVEEVREHRSKLTVCPSAKTGIDVKQLILEFCDNDFYKEDYHSITGYFIDDPVKYEDTIKSMRDIAEVIFI